MLNIKVLGSGCPNCQKVEEHTRQALADLRPAGGYEIEHVKNPLDISEYVLKTPGLVINETVVSEGRIPDTAEIMTWLADALLASE
ncbi:MAG: thioredoxin family protein [Anaerolineae bacterium]|nr:thioredoxin family protein [Anaerolineae bacterium]